MVENIKLVIKGFVIGLGKVIPGVSGAVLAMMLNVYEPALEMISNLKNNFYNNLKFLSWIGIGIIIAVVFGSNVLLFFLKNYYLYTMFLFLGLMLSGVKVIAKQMLETTVKQKLMSSLIVILVFIFSLILPKSNFNMSSKNILLLFISGIFDAISSIVPGISGTAILMLLGSYYPILNSFASIFSIQKFYNNIIVLFPFFVGMVLGTYFISKLINYAFKNYREICYNCIFGFVMLSVVILLFKINIFSYSIWQIILALVYCFVGLLLSKKINI